MSHSPIRHRELKKDQSEYGGCIRNAWITWRVLKYGNSIVLNLCPLTSNPLAVNMPKLNGMDAGEQAASSISLLKQSNNVTSNNVTK